MISTTLQDKFEREIVNDTILQIFCWARQGSPVPGLFFAATEDYYNGMRLRARLTSCSDPHGTRWDRETLIILFDYCAGNLLLTKELLQALGLKSAYWSKDMVEYGSNVIKTYYGPGSKIRSTGVHRNQYIAYLRDNLKQGLFSVVPAA